MSQLGILRVRQSVHAAISVTASAEIQMVEPRSSSDSPVSCGGVRFARILFAHRGHGHASGRVKGRRKWFASSGLRFVRFASHWLAASVGYVRGG